MATVGARPLDEIPFEGLGSLSPPSQWGMPRPSSELKDFGDLNPLYLGGALATAPQKYRVSAGVGGDLHEMQSVFEACLQVGRIERAGVILKRMSKIDDLSPTELLYLNNLYLRAAVEQIMLEPSQTALQSLHKWYELEVRLKGLPQDIETVAYMVKASLQSPAGKGKGKRERLVQRYMDMLDEDSALQLLEAELLTGHEINEITHIYPKYNLSQDIDESEGFLDEMEDTSIPQTTSSPDLDEIPNVRPTDQKGLGLRSLKKSLSLFITLSHDGVDLAQLSKEQKREIQKRIETDAVESAIERWREESQHLSKMGLNAALQTKSLGARMWKWQLALQKYLEEELVRVEEAESTEKRTIEDKERCMYGPFLRLLPTEKLAATTILSCMSILGSVGASQKGMPLSSTIMSLAGSIEDECVIESFKKKNKQVIWPEGKSRRNRKPLMTAENVKNRTKYRSPGMVAKFADALRDPHTTSALTASHAWPLSTKAKVGAILLSALIEVAKVPVSLKNQDTNEPVTQMQPAFSHAFQYKMGKKLGVVVPNKALVSQLQREPVHSLLAKHLPMLVEPEPWTSFGQGGFIAHPSKVMRVKQGDKDQRYYAEAAISQGDMSQTFKGLDVLGKTSWKINQPVFDVMLEAWNTGEAIAAIPAENPNLPIPPEPTQTQDPLERRAWITAVKLVENKRIGLHSQRCFQNFQLEIARALRNETFYFPHNVDFRGRAYPIPPYFNHMGADHCRGLLVFGEGRELGTTGLRWLKIHLSNVFGYDKASLSERENFTMEHLGDIYDSAMNPLKGNRWWLSAEDPWQCLAACVEVRNALESPDPEKFVSSLPVHQDGTCNGLQHYAALGGDTWGAKQVNLEPGDRPADIYSAVAKLVIESMEKDKADGHEFPAILEGKVTRKTVKQTVMTNVYGVTFIGAREQIRKQLIAADKNLPNTDKINPGTLATYIATKVFTALSSMFRGAHDIQFWLGECAQRISTCITPEQLSRLGQEWPKIVADSVKGGSKAQDLRVSRLIPPALDDLVQFKSSVIWTTPLLMPVVQPYRTSKSKSVKTNMQQVALSEPHRSDPVSKRKQLQGFPPNFIHSLDATHMLLSALKCDELGLSFAAVHGSFWTHASDVNKMNGVLRDAFVRVHTEDVIGRLGAEFAARYKGSVYMAKIKTNSAVYAKIAAWREARLAETGRMPKSQKIPRIDELVLEHERARLLNSSDALEVEKGREMVTPGSIFAEMAKESDLEADDDLQDLGGLGDMSTRGAKLSANRRLSVGDETNIEEVNNPLRGGEQLDAALGADDSRHHLALESQDVDAEEERQDDDNEEEKVNTFEATGLKTKARTYAKYSEIWLPLSFPPVPKKVSTSLFYTYALLISSKGDFDVTRLKDSEYFFS